MECLQRRESQPVAWQTSTHVEMLVRSRAQTRRASTGAAWVFNQWSPADFTVVEGNRDGPRLERTHHRRTDLLRPTTGLRGQAKLQVCDPHSPVGRLVAGDCRGNGSRWEYGGLLAEYFHNRLAPKLARSRIAIEARMTS